MSLLTHGSFFLFLFLIGSVLSTQATYWGNGWQDNAVQHTTIENTDDKRPQEKWNVKVKDVSESQQKALSNDKPKMIEKMKIVQRTRKLKNQGEEKTKIIYRTRVIGFDPKTQGNVNYFNLGDKKIWSFGSEEDSDYSDSSDNSKPDVVDKEFKKAGLTQSAFKFPQANEMPIDRHSSKKELREDLNAAKSAVDLHSDNNKPKENSSNFFIKNEIESDKVHKPSVFKKVHFADTVEQFDDRDLKPTDTFRKVNFLDSLELYRNQQLQKQRLLNELRSDINHNNQAQMRPILQRQNAFYRYPPTNLNNQINVKGEPSVMSNKPAAEKPFVSKILQPAANNQINNEKQPNLQLEVTTNRINSEQSEAMMHTLRPDWFGSLLIRKLAQVQAARAEAAREAQLQARQNEMQSKQQTLQQEHRQQIAT